jgi:beta-glucanase (GH16 family)
VIQPRNVGGTWTSARLNTDGGQLFQYGILEASIQLPDMNPQGLWAAFWGLGNNLNSGVPWPNCGETDILEDWSPAVLGGAGDGGENSTIHTMDTGGDGISTRYLFPGGEAVNTAFHTYGMIWSPNEVQYFVDNPSAPFATLTPGSLPAGDTWPFNQSIFMVLNLAIGGTLGGSDAGINPGPMTVDYIRWYQAQ